MSGILTKQLAVLGARELITSLKGLPGNLQAATPQPNNGVTKGKNNFIAFFIIIVFKRIYILKYIATNVNMQLLEQFRIML